jgi:molybdopterin synthase sulfur carrier subunit
MAIKVRIPQPLQKLTQGKEMVDAEGKSVKDLISDLEKNFPGIRDRICDESGTTSLKDGDEVSIIPAIAGGSK